MYFRFFSWLFFGVSCFLGFHWLGTLGPSSFQGEVAAILDPFVTLFLITCAVLAWCLGVWFDWILLKRTRRALWILLLGGLLVPADIAGNYAIEWIRSADSVKEARSFTEMRLQRLMDGDQTIDFAQAEARKFWEDVASRAWNSSRRAEQVYNRYYPLNELYRGAILRDDSFWDTRQTWPKAQCDEFADVFAEVYDPKAHGPILDRLCRR
ncbi:MAG: hypothetical protein ABJ251_17575 [Paracoccaceae bacterium]